MNMAIQGIMFMLLNSLPAEAQVATGLVGGMVESLENGGTLVFRGGEKIELWGLQITDQRRAKEMMLNQNTICAILGHQNQIPIGDCYLSLPGKSEISQRNRIDLFVWLVRFGIARPHCTPYGNELSVRRTHKNGYSYQCDPSGEPLRVDSAVKVE